MARAIRCLQRRPKVAALVSSCGVYNCKVTVGTKLYSAHAFGDAADAMNAGKPDEREQIARAIIRDATKRTRRNRLRRTEVAFVIWNDRQWIRGHGESAYSGVAHSNHVHFACSFSTRAVPACEGGSNYDVRYARSG